MRLQIILGYPDHKPASVPFPVYVGRDAAAADQAMAASSAARFEIFRNPIGGIRKNNPRAAANALGTPSPSSASEEKASELGRAARSMPPGRPHA